MTRSFLVEIIEENHIFHTVCAQIKPLLINPKIVVALSLVNTLISKIFLMVKKNYKFTETDILENILKNL